MNITPQAFQDIAVDDHVGIRFGNVADHVTFSHPCRVVARDADLLTLQALPLGDADGRSDLVAGKTYAEWLPSGTFVLGRTGLNRRSEWFERSAERTARLIQDAREEQLAVILRETGHVDTTSVDPGEPGTVLGSLTLLLKRLESLGLKLPEPVVPGLTAEAVALHATMSTTTAPSRPAVR